MAVWFAALPPSSPPPPGYLLVAELGVVVLVVMLVIVGLLPVAGTCRGRRKKHWGLTWCDGGEGEREGMVRVGDQNTRRRGTTLGQRVATPYSCNPSARACLVND